MYIGKKFFSRVSLILAFFIFYGCAGYKQHIMFQGAEGEYPRDLAYASMLAERNYRIQLNDRLDIRVYTNEGERIIDPDYELQKDLNNNSLHREEGDYFVQKNGKVKIPMVGEVALLDLTLDEAEKKLEHEFSRFYKNPYVLLKFLNKRVIVLGAMGGHVIPLENEGMNLLEILALAGGIEKNTKVQNIKLIRGDLNNPEVETIDLSTIAGMKKADLKVYSGDIIYVEPVVRIVSESTRDFIPIVSIITSLLTLIIVLSRS